MVSSRVVLVKSCRPYRDRSEACVRTWVGDLRDEGVQAFIVEGGAKETSLDDGLITVKSDDASKGNVHYPASKLCEALDFVLKEFSPEYIFIADDDTYVHPKRWLQHTPETEFYLVCLIFRSPEGKMWVHGGGGWYMTNELSCRYVNEFRYCQQGDDYVLGGKRLQKLLVSDRPDLYGGDKYSGHNHRVAEDNSFITCHHVGPAEMMYLHREFV